MKDIVIIGAGGNCKVILDSLDAIERTAPGTFEILGFVDDDEKKQKLYNYHRLGGIKEINNLHQDVYFINSVGDNKFRQKLANNFKGIKYFTVINPTAIIGSNVEIGDGSIIMPGVIINSGSRIGKCCLINSGAIVEHDNKIGNFVHLASGVTTAGNVSVDECTMLGTGSKVIQGIEIGSNTMIGAGAVVISNIPNDVTAVGVPAKIVK